VRGHNPILMDYGIIDVVHPLDPALGVPSYESFEATRYAMGDTLRFATRPGPSHVSPLSGAVPARICLMRTVGVSDG
jgi:hypothetical protein